MGVLFFAFLVLSCSLSPSGNLAFFVELKGYSWGPETGVELKLEHSVSGKSLARSVSFERSDSSSAVFPGTAEGPWTVSVSAHEGTDFLGEEQFTVEARSGDTVTSRITAEYTGSEFNFSIAASSSQGEPSMELTKFETLITAGRRIGMTNPDVGIRSLAFGTFDTASWIELTYPDELTVTAGSKNLLEGVYFNVHGSSLDFYRPEYTETGDFSLILEDTAGTSLKAFDSIDLSADPAFLPEITTPLNDGDALSDGSPVAWINGNTPEVAAVGIILYDETQPEVLTHTEISYTPQTTSQFIIPAGSIIPANFYRVIIFTSDVMITEDDIRNFDSYRAIELPYQAAKYVDENITGFSYYERSVVGA